MDKTDVRAKLIKALQSLAKPHSTIMDFDEALLWIEATCTMTNGEDVELASAFAAARRAIQARKTASR